MQLLSIVFSKYYLTYYPLPEWWKNLYVVDECGFEGLAVKYCLKRCRRGLRGLLLLEDGLLVEGCGFGSPGIRVGEIVFTTGMVGYPETLTDPSFCGQILVATHPLIGNYGVPSRSILEHGLPSHYESDRIWVEAFIVSFETSPSHWASSKSLHEWLAEEGVPGISNVDTRMLVKHIRDKGVMMAVAAVYPEENFLELEYLRKLKLKSETIRY